MKTISVLSFAALAVIIFAVFADAIPIAANDNQQSGDEQANTAAPPSGETKQADNSQTRTDQRRQRLGRRALNGANQQQGAANDQAAPGAATQASGATPSRSDTAVTGQGTDITSPGATPSGSDNVSTGSVTDPNAEGQMSGCRRTRRGSRTRGATDATTTANKTQ